MTLRGDHRQEIYDFLIEEGIGGKGKIGKTIPME